MAKLNARHWIHILFFVRDTIARGALRATHSRVDQAGDITIDIIQIRLKVFNEQSNTPLIFRRIRFWSPWVSYICPRAPSLSNIPAWERWILLWDAFPYHRRSEHRREMMELHGYSDSTILFEEYANKRWVWTWQVYENSVPGP